MDVFYIAILVSRFRKYLVICTCNLLITLFLFSLLTLFKLFKKNLLFHNHQIINHHLLRVLNTTRSTTLYQRSFHRLLSFFCPSAINRIGHFSSFPVPRPSRHIFLSRLPSTWTSSYIGSIKM